jgi:hypothetical protein
MIPTPTMQLSKPEAGDSMEPYFIQVDGPFWTDLTRLSEHDHTGGLNGKTLTAATIPDGSITPSKLHPSVYTPLAFVDGSKPFTGPQEFQADAVIRDALQFGQQGTAAAPDATLARTGAGALRVDSHLGVGVNPAAWHPDRRATQVGVTAAVVGHPTGSHLELVENSYLDGGATQRAVVTAAASRLNMGGGGWTFQNAPSVAAGAAQTFTTRAVLNTSGTLTLTPDAGLAALQTSSHLILSAAAGRVQFYTGHGVVGPLSDNAYASGYSDARWTAVHATNGTIQTSAAEAKQDITPLDPAACAQAVLDTDWVAFRYRDPVYAEPERAVEEAVAAWDERKTAALEAHVRMLAETAHTRHQRGYVLGSPDHKVSDLFGLDDRQSASPSSDVAVVAAALQQALLDLRDARERIEALEAQA